MSPEVCFKVSEATCQFPFALCSSLLPREMLAFSSFHSSVRLALPTGSIIQEPGLLTQDTECSRNG